MAERRLGVLAATALVFGACASGGGAQRVNYRYAGNDPATMQQVDVRPGPMPDGEGFSGSFHSAQIGDVYLEQTGDSVIGTYEYDRASCHAVGRIEGTANGNLVRFRWTESQRSCGRIQPLMGRGYFLFWVDSAHNGRLSGEWGSGDRENGGGPWALFRDRVRRQPPARPEGENGVFDGSSGAAPAR